MKSRVCPMTTDGRTRHVLRRNDGSETAKAILPSESRTSIASRVESSDFEKKENEKDEEEHLRYRPHL